MKKRWGVWLAYCFIGVSCRSSRAIHDAVLDESAGISFNYSIASKMRDGSGVGTPNDEVIVRMRDGNIRMDYVRGTVALCCTATGDRMFSKEGVWPGNTRTRGYVLIRPYAQSIVTVSEASDLHWANAMTPTIFARGASEMTHAYLKLGGGDLLIRDLGKGPKMLGLRTQHLQLVHRFSFSGQGMEEIPMFTRADTSDIWFARVPGLDVNSATTWARSFGAAVYFSNPLLKAGMDQFVQQFGCAGLPLKIITRRVANDLRNKQVKVDTLVATVSSLRREIATDDMLSVPKGYYMFRASMLYDYVPTLDTSRVRQPTKLNVDATCNPNNWK